jgi:two-component system CheB/CheR fusion protein
MATALFSRGWQLAEQPPGDGASEQNARSAEGRGQQRSGQPLRVLVVEDSADTGESLAMLLRLYGHEVEVARDGATARQAAGRLTPAVLLIDIGLPKEDGYAVAKCLRGAMRSKPLLVAITGYGQEQDHQRSRAEGFDHHLVKPVEPDELKHLLEAFATQEQEHADALN